jgi:hypothetical protein
LRPTPRRSNQTIFEKHPTTPTAACSSRPSRSRSARAASTPALNTGRCDATRLFAASKRSRFFMRGEPMRSADGRVQSAGVGERERPLRCSRPLKPGLACASRNRADPEHSPWLHDFCSPRAAACPLSGPRQHTRRQNSGRCRKEGVSFQMRRLHEQPLLGAADAQGGGLVHVVLRVVLRRDLLDGRGLPVVSSARSGSVRAGGTYT